MNPFPIKCLTFKQNEKSITPANSPKTIYVFMVDAPGFNATPNINPKESLKNNNNCDAKFIQIQ